jgi:hypothetical protein
VNRNVPNRAISIGNTTREEKKNSAIRIDTCLHREKKRVEHMLAMPVAPSSFFFKKKYLAGALLFN